MFSRQIFVALAVVFIAACSKPDANGSWTFSSDLTRQEPDFKKGAEGDKAIAVMASFIPRLNIANNSWTVMRDSIRCTVEKLNEDKGVTCINVKDGKPSGSMRLEVSGDTLKLKESNKPTYVYAREK